MVCDQLDLFDDVGSRADPVAPPRERLMRLLASDLDDAALIAAIPRASLADYRGLTEEAGRRRLESAVPALEALCRRLAGLGRKRPVAEQEAALSALAEIGGAAAADAVARLVGRQDVEGPSLTAALAAAVRLGVRLPEEISMSLLRHPLPQVRAAACRCARPSAAVMALLLALLDDLDRRVAGIAACALGHAGRREARPMLLRVLRETPSAEVIDAAIAVADEECVVVFGQIARTWPNLAEAAVEALDAVASPRAVAIADAARRSLPS